MSSLAEADATVKDSSTTAQKIKSSSSSKPPAATPRETARASNAVKKAPSSSVNSHQKGRPPKQPSATLPAGSPRPPINDEARRGIAAGPTDDDRLSPLDAELQVLRDAERALFPRPLQGLRAGWSWDFDAATSANEGLPGNFILPGEVPASEVTRPSEPVGKWLGDLILPNVPTRLEPNVVTYLQFYRATAQGKSLLRTWAKKGGRYAKLIATEFTRAGLPTDLLWQSMIESGFNPAAKSPAGAVGLWQFLPDTARIYGLVVDRWIDERLDPERSTQASAKFLADLHRRFGNWDLALAAYNMGYAGLGRAIRKYNTNDYWRLCNYESGIPWETTLYVPKIVALAVAMNNRATFGIEDVEPDSPVQSDVVTVGPGVPLSAVAKAAGVNESEIAQLNPQILAGRTPPLGPAQSQAAGNYVLRVPSGTGPIVSRKIAAVASADASWDSYVIKQGDTLDSIARAAGISVTELRATNQIAASEILSAGDVLLVPKRDRPLDVDFAEDEKVVVVPRAMTLPPGTKRVFYRIVAGDTLSSIARAFEVRRSDLLEWNNLDSTARLQAKMVLAVLVPDTRSLAKVRYATEADVRILVAGSQEFAEYFESLRGNERVVVQARAGDTLATIASRYRLNVATLERVNRRPRTTRYGEGESVVIYAPKGKGPKPASAQAQKQGQGSDASGEIAPDEPRVQPKGPVKSARNPSPDAG